MSLTPPVSVNDHLTANASAAIQLVEYGDFECPHCGRAYPIIKELVASMAHEIAFVFRPFPLKKVHPHALEAAMAAEAAANQGLFWEMHDILFENQRRLVSSAIYGYAELVGLNLEQFSKHMLDDATFVKVNHSFMSGLRSGVNATPSFFINGEKYNDGWEHEQLKVHLVKIQNELFERLD